MKSNNGIGTRLYMLIGFITVFIIGISSFTWDTFRNSNVQNKSRLEKNAEYVTMVDEARTAQVDFKIQVQDWKDTLLRGNDAESFDKYYSQFKQDNNNVQAELQKIKGDMTKQGIDTSNVDALINSHKDLFDKYTTAINSYDQKNINSFHIVDTLVKGIDRKPTDDMSALVKQIEDNANLQTQKMLKQSDTDVNNFNRYLILIVSVGIMLIILFTILIMSTYKSITNFINQLKLLMEQAENGDLTIKGKIYKKDELGQLVEKFNSFIEKIRSLIYEAKETSVTVVSSSNEIMRTTDEVSKATAEVAGTIENLAESASKQANLAEQSNKAVNVVVEGIKRINENTEYITKLANNAIETVTNGTASIKQQSERMNNTKNASYNVTDVISDLSAKSKEIGKVVEFINSITEQINLLSLNASIEAARAGEAGRGFTVVANEVKKLAELSKESTQKISSLITEVQTDIKKAVNDVNDTMLSIEEQATSLKLTDDSFNLIQESVFEMANKIKEVSNYTKEINQNASEVESTINNMVNIIEENAANTEEVASTTEEQTASVEEVASSMNELANLSNNLQESINKFKL